MTFLEKHGIDISRWQGDIDFSKLFGKIDFAIVRATYGTYLDTCAKKNLIALNSSNIPAGLYAFSYALSEQDAIAEADAVCDFAKDYKIDYPVYFDFEDASAEYYKKQTGKNISKNFVTKITSAFCKRVEDNGYFAGFYANKNFLNNYYDADMPKQFALWYAFWNDECDKNCGMWQYSSTGKMVGIDGFVDENICFVDYPSIIKDAGLNKSNYGSIEKIKKYIAEINAEIERGEKNGFR